MTTEIITVHLVDDDVLFLKTMETALLQNTNFEIKCYHTGEECLEMLTENTDVVILDYHLDGTKKGAINGLETLKRIKKYNPDIPVIMLSSQDKIEVAVECMHNQAFDYIVKSETSFVRLQAILNKLFKYNKLEKALKWYIDKT
jgi:two-component system OmpR family response regulator